MDPIEKSTANRERDSIVGDIYPPFPVKNSYYGIDSQLPFAGGLLVRGAAVRRLPLRS